ncbi:hypothetical protein [endosymbiont GvMRE of Glomus versiforme]|uniref:hypothetical protein n=1 Tax=endosymbiont GvMRE of Glomus versiforme TaxID=2039283 RepID=UPI000ECD1C55|nr:hypothetical protein [endosymbiont GvMRE of Glomus versiforme]RHZ35260.1 hypothetical protein GvMRE_IIg466 [endosymbiont GvMRE of Glomus versiforme]
MVNLGIKDAVKDWMTDKYENWIKQLIEKKTQELENLVSQQVNTHSQKAKETAYKPVNYYQNQPTFYRGLFWIAIGLLIVLWIVSGS